MKTRFKILTTGNILINGFLVVLALLISIHFAKAQDFSAYKK